VSPHAGSLVVPADLWPAYDLDAVNGAWLSTFEIEHVAVGSFDVEVLALHEPAVWSWQPADPSP
jgi:hypothetical protein